MARRVMFSLAGCSSLSWAEFWLYLCFCASQYDQEKVTTNASPSLLEATWLLAWLSYYSQFPSRVSLEAVPGFSRGTPLGLYDLGLRDGLWELREPSDGIPEIRYKPSYTQGFRFFSGGLVSISLLTLGPLNSDVQKHPFHHLTI